MLKSLLSLLILILGLIFFSWQALEKERDANFCAFCDSSVLEYQKFYEDDVVIALYTHKPILAGHSLIIPKRHVERFEMLSEIEISRVGEVIKKVNQATEKVFGTSSYLLLQKNGKEAGQTVPHVHFHYIPRQINDDSIIKFFIKMYVANLSRPLQQIEMQEMVEKMKVAMEPHTCLTN